MGKFKINKTISQADSIFNSTLEYIEKKLKENIVSVKKMDKLYGSKSNNNTVITAGNFGGLNRYVLKFSTQDDIEGEVRGTKFIEDYLPVPKTILSSKNKDNSWLLREYVPGVLMTDVTNHFEVTDKNGRLEEMEREKERLVVLGYEKKIGQIRLKEYLNLPANNLFHKRINGARFKDFFLEGEIVKYLDKQIIVNGNKNNLTLRQMFESIRTKYSTTSAKQISTYPGHGDAHQGNVIVSDKGNIHFFDNEYSGMMPSLMDLSKPYYNDLLGALFFYFHPQLLNYFELKSYKSTANSLSFQIRLKQQLKTRMELAKIKLRQRKKYISSDNDFLSLNDYLFMCHTLTKDPNLYPDDIKKLFLAFCLIIYEFDPLNPESIYEYFVK